MNREDLYLDYIETLSEELNLNGFKNKVVIKGYKYYLEMDTIAGIFKYEATFSVMMMDYYRFIRIYGSQLSRWALPQQFKVEQQNRDNNEFIDRITKTNRDRLSQRT